MKNGRHIVSILGLLTLAITGCESKPQFEVRRVSLSDTSEIFETTNVFVTDELAVQLDSGKTVHIDWKAIGGFKVYDTTSDPDAFSATNAFSGMCGFSLGETACMRSPAPKCKGRCYKHCGK